MAASEPSFFGRRYLAYLIVAGAVGVITVALREFIGFLLADTPFNYALSVLLAYGCGVMLNYAWQLRFTFATATRTGTPRRFGYFAVVAIGGSLLTMATAYALRYEFGFEYLFAGRAGIAAFCMAALITSLASYYLNARYIFVSNPNSR